MATRASRTYDGGSGRGGTEGAPSRPPYVLVPVGARDGVRPVGHGTARTRTTLFAEALGPDQTAEAPADDATTRAAHTPQGPSRPARALAHAPRGHGAPLRCRAGTCQ
ncbi:hypothetical protein GCM10010392_52130 [Streptomyces clavifer]|nr:hypothetical protein GCM10010392_52130 [Streptomyces clavifer]